MRRSGKPPSVRAPPGGQVRSNPNRPQEASQAPPAGPRVGRYPLVRTIPGPPNSAPPAPSRSSRGNARPRRGRSAEWGFRPATGVPGGEREKRCLGRSDGSARGGGGTGQGAGGSGPRSCAGTGFVTHVPSPGPGRGRDPALPAAAGAQSRARPPPATACAPPAGRGQPPGQPPKEFRTRRPGSRRRDRGQEGRQTGGHSPSAPGRAPHSRRSTVGAAPRGLIGAGAPPPRSRRAAAAGAGDASLSSSPPAAAVAASWEKEKKKSPGQQLLESLC